MSFKKVKLIASAIMSVVATCTFAILFVAIAYTIGLRHFAIVLLGIPAALLGFYIGIKLYTTLEP